MDGNCTIQRTSLNCHNELLITTLLRQYNLNYKKVTIYYIEIKLSHALKITGSHL